MEPPRSGEHQGGPNGVVAVTTVAGLVHAAFSIHWALGGTLLLRTVGDDVVRAVGTSTLLLVVVCVGKLALALLPVALGPRRRVPRIVALGTLAVAVPMALWGLANVVVGGAVLLGVLHPPGAVDGVALRGHVLLWDPLFVVWGAGLSVLAVSHLRSRRGTS
jgi:hypothetical protein